MLHTAAHESMPTKSLLAYSDYDAASPASDRSLLPEYLEN